MKNIKLFISCILLALTLTSPRVVHGMQAFPSGDTKKPSGIQLAKAADDRLEATVGTGNNVLLKIDVSLESFKRPVDDDQVTVSARLFLTDFTSSPTKHPDVRFAVKIDCESTTPACVLPKKPPSFSSYTQFTDWLNQAYFTNQVKITYDFHVDIQKLAPSLAQCLFFVPPDGYRFIGTYVLDNTNITPDAVSPQISYLSQRGDINTTTATLGGTVYLNKKPYLIEDNKHVIAHQKISERIFEKDVSLFYHYKWIARSQTISKFDYEESSTQLWPNLPDNKYSILKKQWDSKEDILHISCFVGSSGEEIDISDGKVFWMKYPTAGEIKTFISENIIRDSESNLYIVKYKNLTQINKDLGLDAALREYDNTKRTAGIADLKYSLRYQEEYAISVREELKKLEGWSRSWPCRTKLNYSDKKCGDTDYSNSGSWQPKYCEDCIKCSRREEVQKNLPKIEEKIKNYKKSIEEMIRANEQNIDLIRNKMAQYQTQAGVPHPRWDEFSKIYRIKEFKDGEK